jgi:RNA polymerase sigma-70 factor (ECF subfamily)
MSAAAQSWLPAPPFIAGQRGPIVRSQHRGCAVAGDSDGRWESWMIAAQAGDARAYDLLLRDCLPLLRAVARRRLRDAHEAEDAVQDTLLTIHRMLAAYDPSRPLRPWIVAIAERRCIDRLRRHGRGAGRETPIDDHAETLAAPVTETGETRIAGRELRDAVAGLPESQRTALRLAKFEDLPLAEAARRSGLSVGALKVATHRALKTLRRRLGGEDAP